MIGNSIMPAAASTEIAEVGAPAPVEAPTQPLPQLWYRPTGDKMMEPFVTPITAAEHKIRNLEKRKLKLDQYQAEQADGKTLNADQLAAVAKYSEVIQQLEHNREMVACLRQIHQQTSKFIKQELKRENAERNKFILSLVAGFGQLRNPIVQRDLLRGELGAVEVSEGDIKDLMDISNFIVPSLREPDFPTKIEAGAEMVAKLFESRGLLNNKPSQQLKTMMESIIESQYFASNNSDATGSLKDAISQTQETLDPVQILETTMRSAHPMVPAQIMNHEAAYSFLQESQVEIESPRMDSGLVMVSSIVSSTMEILPEPEINQIFTTAPSESLTSIQPGGPNLKMKTAWNRKPPENVGGKVDKINTATFNNSTFNGDLVGDEKENRKHPRSGRGNFRGRGGRGRGGSSHEHDNPKPFKTGIGKGGYHHGTTRGAFIGQSDAETSGFGGNDDGGYPRSFKRNNEGGFPRSFKGNDGGASRSAAGPPRRGGGRGAARTFNATNQPPLSE